MLQQKINKYLLVALKTDLSKSLIDTFWEGVRMQAYGGPFAFYYLYSSGLDPLPCTTQRGTKSFKIQPNVSPLEKGKGCPAPTSEKDLTVSLNQIFKFLAPHHMVHPQGLWTPTSTCPNCFRLEIPVLVRGYGGSILRSHQGLVLLPLRRNRIIVKI